MQIAYLVVLSPITYMVGLGPGHIVLDGDSAYPSPKGHSPPIFGQCLLWSNASIDQDPLGTKVGISPGDIVLDGDPGPLKEGSQPPPQFSAHVYCGQTVIQLSYCSALV